MVSLEITDLRKEFGSLVAVDSVSFSLEQNEILSLVGPSGCGKTTTLRCLAGLEEPTAGSIEMDGHDIVDEPPQERDIALLFQDLALWDHMTVRENMAFPLQIKGIESEEIRDRVQQGASQLQISDKLDDKPAQLSGGQQQRVALGRSLVQNPNLFLFDEPLSDLDAALKREIQPLIKRVVREANVPAVYVTHDQEEAMNLSDKIIVMNNGHIEQIGAPLEVFDSPANRFVGEFIGEPKMNIFSPTVSERDGTTVISIHGIEITTTESVPENVQVGVRPQDMSVVDDESATEGIRATHVLDEPVGDFTISHFEIGTKEIAVQTAKTFRGDNEEYFLRFDAADVHVFDEQGAQQSTAIKSVA